MDNTNNTNLAGLAERIRQLRREKGLSQEQLADQIGVSRQAVSKWESEQSAPELDKVLALSLLFQTSTDYLLKGEQPAKQKKPDARIFAIVATALNGVGLLLAAIGWAEDQTARSVGSGLLFMAMGCMIFAVGRVLGEEMSCRQTDRIFWPVNIWILLLVPVSALVGGLFALRFEDFRFAKLWAFPREMAVIGVVYLLLCLLGESWIFRLLKKKGQK